MSHRKVCVFVFVFVRCLFGSLQQNTQTLAMCIHLSPMVANACGGRSLCIRLLMDMCVCVCVRN